MKTPIRSTSTKRGRFAIMGLPIVLMALGLAVFLALAPAPERGFNSPSAEAKRNHRPTDTPASTPTDKPTSTPTDTPTSTPTDTPTRTPTSMPTDKPTSTPTDVPTDTPTSTPEPGSITICKATKPGDTGMVFDFDTDIPGMTDLVLQDGECATQDDLDQGDYEITEDLSALPEWELYHIHCDGASFDDIDVDLDNATVSVYLESGADVECTFFNKLDDEPEPGSITVCVVTDPAGSGKSFDFDTDIPGMTDMDLEHGECDSQDGLDEGDYEVTEDLFGLPSGWRLEDIDCDGTSSGNIDIDLGHATVSIFLPQGEDVECTFFNKFKEEEPTSTPVPPKTCDDYAMGDVNGPAAKPGDERKVNSIDAAIILQFNAGHINSLPCPNNADVNEDGKIDATDALIIIQFTAKFIFHLPV